MLKWYVYLEDVNKKKIIKYNVFNHYSFCEYLKNAVENIKNKNEFSEKVKRLSMYYFWAKCEYEILITTWLERKDFKSEKIDVYDQLQLNWNVFINYIWENKKEILKNEI